MNDATRAGHAGRGEGLSEEELRQIERDHHEGLTIDEICRHYERTGERVSEPALRKYVQLGLMPKSRRVGRDDGKGSRGLYPATAVRQLQELKALMRRYSIEEIKRRGLGVSGEVDVLADSIERVCVQLQTAFAGGEGGASARGLQELERARELGEQLIERLRITRSFVLLRARMEHAEV